MAIPRWATYPLEVPYSHCLLLTDIGCFVPVLLQDKNTEAKIMILKINQICEYGWIQKRSKPFPNLWYKCYMECCNKNRHLELVKMILPLCNPIANNFLHLFWAIQIHMYHKRLENIESSCANYNKQFLYVNYI